jgi:uncharacterized membrane protein
MMTTSRLEAFSDAVIAILMTIMVLELTVPHEADLAALRPLIPIFLAYVLSFINLGIYWHTHHHMIVVVDRVNGPILWANLHLLFWLSLFPFTTAWMGENEFAAVPTAIYGVVALFAAVAYFLLKTAVIKEQGQESRLATAYGNDLKGKMSPIFYLIAIPLSFVNRWIALALYVLVALMWLIPDRRIEAFLAEEAH